MPGLPLLRHPARYIRQTDWALFEASVKTGCQQTTGPSAVEDIIALPCVTQPDRLTYRCRGQQSTPNTRPFVQSVAAQNDDTEERGHLQTFPPVADLNDMIFDILTRLTGSRGGNSADLWTPGNLSLRSGGWYEVCRQLLNNFNHFELWLYIKVGEKLR
ncbi:hypothetical protein MTO96_039264 [Rhipicephalus appendiculatus]